VGPFLLAVEAKADESFGQTVEEARVAALARKEANPRSNGIARIDRLLAALLPACRQGLALDGALRYQLLTATAGALCEANRRGLSRAMLVHEFGWLASS
jgi:hypothetical protein